MEITMMIPTVIFMIHDDSVHHDDDDDDDHIFVDPSQVACEKSEGFNFPVPLEAR